MLSRKHKPGFHPAMRVLAAWFFLLLPGMAEIPAASLNFVHVTDPHFFAAGGRAEENERALKWCIEEVNNRVAAGAQLAFVAVTGNLGIQNIVSPGTNTSAAGFTAAARRLGRVLADSKVPLWFFVPGSDDLVAEDPGTISNYFSFIQALQDEARGLTILDLTPRTGLPKSGRYDFDFGTNRWRMAGFDNASFRNNDSATNAALFSTNQQASVARLRAALAAEPPFTHALIFYHLPEIEDPFYAFLPAPNTKLLEREQKRGALGTNYPFSAWTVKPEVRDDWNAVVTNPAVRGLFAGHFHSPVRSVYESFSWLHDPAKSSNSVGKLVIAPPLGSKRQENAQPAARGFREISFDVESGALLFAKITWVSEVVKQPAPPGDISAADSLALIAIGAIFMAIGLSMTSIIRLLEPAPAQSIGEGASATAATATRSPAAETSKDKATRLTGATFEVLKLGNPAIAQWLITVAQAVFVILGIFFIFLGMAPLVLPGASWAVRGWGFRTTLLLGVVGLTVGMGFFVAAFRKTFGTFFSLRPEVVMNITFITFFVLGFAGIALFAQDLRGFGAASLWALGALAVGAFFGLLFGIHKTAAKTDGGDSPGEYRPQINNNLIEVSDWLTKIIVGVGLIELRNFDDYVLGLSETLAECLGEHCGLAVAAGILIAFTFSGFLAGFLNSRTFLTEILRRYDQLLLQRFGSKVDERISALDDAPIVLEGGVAEFGALAKEAAEYILTLKLEDLHNWREIRLWAKAALSKGRTADAIKAYQRALAIVPKDAETRLEYAAALNQEGAGVGVILTQLEIARDSIMRSTKDELRKNIYKSLLYQYLYLKQPESFKKALEAAREYLATENPVMSGGLWVNIACAYGQAYSWLTSAAVPQGTDDIKVPDDVPDLRLSKQELPTNERFLERGELARWIKDQALFAMRQALRRDRKWVQRLRHLSGLDSDSRPPGMKEEDNDLAVFLSSPYAGEFELLLEAKPPDQSPADPGGEQAPLPPQA